MRTNLNLPTAWYAGWISITRAVLPADAFAGMKHKGRPYQEQDTSVGETRSSLTMNTVYKGEFGQAGEAEHMKRQG